MTLPELLVAILLIGLLVLAAAPAVATLRTAGRGAAGARHMTALLQALRWESVARRTQRGLWFERDGRGWHWFRVEDGNGNGLRTAELRNGTDTILSGPHRLEDAVEHVRVGFPGNGPLPAIPPRSGPIGDLDDPVKFGRANLISFSPLGRASSGTLYVSDGDRQLYGIVLFGPTTRVRVWRYEPRAHRWSL